MLPRRKIFPSKKQRDKRDNAAFEPVFKVQSTSRKSCACLLARKQNNEKNIIEMIPRDRNNVETQLSSV